MSGETFSVPGGARAVNVHANAIPANAIDVTASPNASAYQESAFASGIPFRPHGLFPPSDPLLERLAKDPDLRPFEKHLIDPSNNGLVIAEGSWASGDSAAVGGRIDLRCFLRLSPSVADTDGAGAKLEAAVRFGDSASIGNGMSAHGGAIETALDEATAELCKATQGPMCLTTTAEFKLKKQVALHETHLIEAEIVKLGIRGMRIFVDATMKDGGGQVVAQCSAQLANMTKLQRR